MSSKSSSHLELSLLALASASLEPPLSPQSFSRLDLSLFVGGASKVGTSSLVSDAVQLGPASPVQSVTWLGSVAPAHGTASLGSSPPPQGSSWPGLPTLVLARSLGSEILVLDVSHLGLAIFTHSSVHLEPVLPVPDPQNLGLFPSSRSFARLELPVLVSGLAHFGFIYHLLVLSSLHLDFSSSARSSVHPGASTLASGLASFDLSLFLQGGVRLESAMPTAWHQP